MKRKELLATQLNVQKTPNEKSTSTIMNETIDETPFRMVGNHEKGFFIAMGNYRLTEPTPSILEAFNKLDYEKWHIIIRVIDSILHAQANGEQAKMTEEQLEQIKHQNRDAKI